MLNSAANVNARTTYNILHEFHLLYLSALVPTRWCSEILSKPLCWLWRGEVDRSFLNHLTRPEITILRSQ